MKAFELIALAALLPGAWAACDAATEYLDISSLNCVVCSDTEDGTANNKVIDSSDVDDEGNVLSCTCDAGYYKVDEACTEYSSAVQCTAFSCTSCAADEAATQDRSMCLPCDGVTATYDDATGDCACVTAGYVLTETDAAGEWLSAKECLACPSDAYAFAEAAGDFEADVYTCQTCTSDHMSLSSEGVCTCDTGYEESGIDAFGGRVCLLEEETVPVSSYVSAASWSVSYLDVESQVDGTLGSATVTESKWFTHLFEQSGVDCWAYGGPSDLPACQALGNLCVLQLFQPDSMACMLFEAIRTARLTTISNGVAGWSETLPWLMYQDDGEQVMLSRDIDMQVSFDNATIPDTFDELRFAVARYDVYGNYLGLDELSTQFYYCDTTSTTETGPSGLTHWLKFGVGYKESFSCDLSSLLSGDLPEFYDLYLIDEASGALSPVPVRVKNYRDGDSSFAAAPNRNKHKDEEIDDVFTRRFFLWDRYTGVEEASPDATPTYLRYARSIKLTVTVQPDDTERMFPPILTIDYVERPTSAFGSDGMGSDTITFSVEYSMDTTGFWDSAIPLFTLTCVMAFGFGLVRYYNFSKRHSRESPVFHGMSSAIFMVVALCGTFAKGLFAFLFCMCAYWYTFFKMQDAVAALLPPERPEYGTSDDYYQFDVLLHLAWVTQLVRMGEILYRQCRCDVFFMDWEKKRGPSIPVSWWRTLFVANEWAERQTERRSSLIFTLFWVAMALVACDGQYWATPQPDAEDLSVGPLNPVLRLALIVFWFFLFAGAQLLWKWAIQDRYFTEPMTTQFIDLCTIAKISVVLLDEPFHGYYLHCCSPYGYADGSMVDMADQLDQESKALTTDRGLEGCPVPDAQAFEMHVVDRFRRRYDDVYKSLVTQAAAQHGSEAARFALQAGGARARNRGRPPPSRLVKASRQLNRFLQDFVSNDHAEFKRVFRTQSYWPRFFRLPPDMPANTRHSAFVPDVKHNYAEMVFYGQEVDLLLFDVLTLCIFTEWTDSVMFGVFFTWLWAEFYTALRSSLGQANISAKTLVDSRFMI